MLVPFKSYKLESKTRAKEFGKVDMMETYQSTMRSLLLAGHDRDARATQVWAPWRCNTLIQLCVGLLYEGELCSRYTRSWGEKMA